METGLTKNKIIAELTKSPHGDLKEYVAVGSEAAKREPEFFAHLIAWNRIKGQVRDSKVALPIVSLCEPALAPEFVDNALAHLGLLGPRELLRAFRFGLEVRPKNHGGQLRRLVARYLFDKEANWPRFERTAIQHRRTLKELYAVTHTKPGDKALDILFKRKYPEGSMFQAVATLSKMSPLEAAGTILNRGIPFLIAVGALGEKAKEPDLVLALLDRMSPTELVTNTKMFERLGIKSNPALRGAYEKALEKAASGKENILKTTRAAEAVEDPELKAKLQALQERQLKSSGIEGNWLVLADKSGSMQQAINISREVAATLAKMVKGNVWLVFFDTMPMAIDVTGLSLDQIKKATEHIHADGGTSIGCGLLRMMDAGCEIDGIAIVSDGGENTAPHFPAVYQQYEKRSGKSVPVYLYHTTGEPNSLASTMGRAGIDMQTFDLRGQKPDYYSLPNLVATMRTNRYSLVDEVMETRLLKLDDVFKSERKEANAIA